MYKLAFFDIISFNSIAFNSVKIANLYILTITYFSGSLGFPKTTHVSVSQICWYDVIHNVEEVMSVPVDVLLVSVV